MDKVEKLTYSCGNFLSLGHTNCPGISQTEIPRELTLGVLWRGESQCTITNTAQTVSTFSPSSATTFRPCLSFKLSEAPQSSRMLKPKLKHSSFGIPLCTPLCTENCPPGTNAKGTARPSRACLTTNLDWRPSLRGLRHLKLSGRTSQT